jgi:hypothetical protein
MHPGNIIFPNTNTPTPHYPIFPTIHHSIIPVWNMQDGWLGIPYYQQFVEFPLHINCLIQAKVVE